MKHRAYILELDAEKRVINIVETEVYLTLNDAEIAAKAFKASLKISFRNTPTDL